MSINASQHKVSLQSECNWGQIHSDLSDFTSIVQVSLGIRLTQELSAKLRAKLLRPQDWRPKEVMCATFNCLIKLRKHTSHTYSKCKVLAIVTQVFWAARNDLTVRVLSCCRSKVQVVLGSAQSVPVCICPMRILWEHILRQEWNLQLATSHSLNSFEQALGLPPLFSSRNYDVRKKGMALCVATYFFKANHWLNRIFSEQDPDRRKHIDNIKSFSSVVEFLAKTAYQKFTSQYRSKFIPTCTALQPIAIGLIWASPLGARLAGLTP